MQWLEVKNTHSKRQTNNAICLTCFKTSVVISTIHKESKHTGMLMSNADVSVLFDRSFGQTILKRTSKKVGWGAPYLSRGECLETNNGYFIICADFVIISRVSKGKGKQALFLQVCFCSEI